MLTLRITDANQKIHNYSGPSSWAEITPKQLRVWAKVCLLKTKVSDALKAITFIFFGIKEKVFEQLEDEQHHQIHSKISFLQKNTCFFWVIPSFTFLLKKYYGPANRLSNLTINEYRVTELYYQLFIKQNDVKHLHYLIATLYRPKRGEVIKNDVRADYNEYQMARRAKYFKWLPASLKYATLFNYEGCRYYIQDHPKFKKLFKKGEAGKKEMLFDYDTMIQGVAGGIFGTYKETGETNLYTFLERVVKQIEDVENLK